MTQIEQILSLAKAYAASTGVELSTVSSRVFADGKKLAALEGGADIQTRRAEQALRWFAVNWPKGARWPRLVPKPEVLVRA